ncbi:MAG: aldehyde dehydrogenase family protein [Pseudomonadota bacterium]
MQTEQFPNLINGAWIQSNTSIRNVNPSDTREVIGDYASATTSDVDNAVSAAREAFDNWSQSELEDRKRILDYIGDELIRRSSELGELLAREEGKPKAEGAGEVYRAGQFFQYYGAEVLRQMGENAASVRPGIDIDVHREPLGVIGVITPWNFPTAIAAWKIAPALAYGNCVVLKPAELTPASAWALSEIIQRSGLPHGVFNLVMGAGSVVGEHLTHHPEVDAVSFTGSVPVGRHIAQNVTARMARVQLEMGSKNALVVLDDADLDLAVSCAVGGAFGGTGQKCTASSRLVVQAGIHDAFVERLIGATQALTVGHALTDGTQIGPLVDDTQLAKNLGYIELAKEEGATLACGGHTVDTGVPGHYLAPTLFTQTHNTMKVNREELFGPIACVIKVDTYEEALAVSNDSDYGLTAGIMTRSLEHAAHFKRHAKAGCVMVNLPTAGTDYHVPFGGRKASSYGPREQGSYAKEFYTIVKTCYSKPY